MSALRRDLIAAGYDVEALRSLWGGVADDALARGHRVPALRALDSRAEGVLATLARLFVLGVPVSEDSLAAALPNLGVPGAEELGLVRLEGGQAMPLLDLRPYAFVDAHGAGRWWIVSDLGELALGGALPEAHVLGVGGASVTLAGLQLPLEVDRVLDLGTGSGIQALHASRFARHVVATDISPRALELAAFNSELNAIPIELREGDLFAPVAGERFGLVVSNPPFVITPRVEGAPAYEYRDGGLEGDGIVEAVVSGLPDVLEPGGFALLLGNWEYREGRDGLERALGFATAAGLDAWIVERDRLDPSRYAETWIRDGGTRPGSEEFERLHGLWLDDFERRGVVEVGFGYLLLRRPPAGRPTLRRAERITDTLGENTAGLGAHLLECVRGHDWQSGRDDRALLAARLAVAPDVTEQRHFWPGDEHPAALDLRQGGGFARTVPLDTALAAFVGASDGELTVGQIVAALADLLDVDEAELTADLLPRVRALVDDAMLRPKADAP